MPVVIPVGINLLWGGSYESHFLHHVQPLKSLIAIFIDEGSHYFGLFDKVAPYRRGICNIPIYRYLIGVGVLRHQIRYITHFIIFLDLIMPPYWILSLHLSWLLCLL